MKIYFYIWCLLSLISCNNNKPDINNSYFQSNKQKNEFVLKFDSILVKNISRNQIINDKYIYAWIGQFKLEIFQRQCFDSAESTEKDLSFPLILDQKINMLFKDKKVEMLIPSNKYIQKTISNNSYLVVENRIISIGIIGVRSDTIITVAGFGGCSSCSEFAGIYNLQGDYLETLHSIKHDKTSITINNKYPHKYDIVEAINNYHYKIKIDSLN